MKKYPNTSILTLISQSESKKEKNIKTENEVKNEKLLFIYLKPVPDFYPENGIHWYPNMGKNGKAGFVWGDLAIKQWVACGKDSHISDLFNTICLTRKLIFDKTEIILTFPTYKIIPFKKDSFSSRRETIYDSFITDNEIYMPYEFYQKENLEYLSGYKKGTSKIKHLYPIGFFEDNFIYSNIKKGIWGIREYRTPYLTFHGVRATSEKGVGSKEMVGFYQQNFDKTSTYSAIVKNEESKEIGNSLIDKNNGFFKIELMEPSQKGKVEILLNKKSEKSIEYFLIQDIKIKFDINIASTIYKDDYGRDFTISSKDKTRPKKISNFTWQRNVYIDTEDADKALLDKLKILFDYLGPKILIADPYFLGNFYQDEITNQITPSSNCQTALINALIHSAIEKGITEINCLGYFRRAKKYIENDNSLEKIFERVINPKDLKLHFQESSSILEDIETSVKTKTDKIHLLARIENTFNIPKVEQVFEKYGKYFSRLINENKLEFYFPKQTILFKNANEDFHNRYWFSIAEKDGITFLDKCVIVTNSIENMKEVDFISVEDETQLKQINRRFISLFHKSEIKQTI